MTYAQAIQELSSLPRFGAAVGLQRMSALMAALGNPHHHLQYVHVTGTNGKGSTCAFTSAMLQAAGYKVGLFTSPHLFDWTERIQINSQKIPKKAFVTYFKRVMQAVSQLTVTNQDMAPAIFDVLTAMALLYFFDQSVDIAVLEVGMGGRFDSTNVIPQSVSVITNIDLEHTEVLGNSKTKIAQQKAGIIKPQGQVITGETDPESLRVIAVEARKHDATLTQIVPTDITEHVVLERTQQFTFHRLKNIVIPFLARYEAVNACLAIAAVEAVNTHYHLNIAQKHIRRGLKQTTWPLRFEVVHASPRIILDAGHNLHGMKALRHELERLPKHGAWILITGASQDKPYTQMAPLVAPLMDTIIVTKALHNAAPPAAIAKSLRQRGLTVCGIMSLRQCLIYAKKIAQPGDTIFVLGGLYLAVDAAQLIPKIFTQLRHINY